MVRSWMSCDWHCRCAPCWGQQEGTRFACGQGAHHELLAACMMHPRLSSDSVFLFLVGGDWWGCLGPGPLLGCIQKRCQRISPRQRSKQQSHAWRAVAELVWLSQWALGHASVLWWTIDDHTAVCGHVFGWHYAISSPLLPSLQGYFLCNSGVPTEWISPIFWYDSRTWIILSPMAHSSGSVLARALMILFVGVSSCCDLMAYLTCSCGRGGRSRWDPPVSSRPVPCFDWPMTWKASHAYHVTRNPVDCLSHLWGYRCLVDLRP